MLAEIGTLNARLTPGQLGPVGAVIGPTHIEPELDLVSASCLFLAPGVGTQGATPADVGRVFAACPDRVMPSASRSLLRSGPDVDRLRDGAAALAASSAPCSARRASAGGRHGAGGPAARPHGWCS